MHREETYFSTHSSLNIALIVPFALNKPYRQFSDHTRLWKKYEKSMQVCIYIQ